jgi:hypothetical protein
VQRLLIGLVLVLGLASVQVLFESKSSTAKDQVPIAEPEPLTIYGATDLEKRRLEEAIQRFESVGLMLPPLAVIFHDNEDPCRDHPGLFLANTDPWEIHICSESVAIVYEHELSHAWVALNVTERRRQAFMDLAGYETWNDQGSPWNERGSEGAALVIQQGISGLPLPPVLAEKTRTLHVEGYKLLTGVASPRYVAWLDTYGDGGEWSLVE